MFRAAAATNAPAGAGTFTVTLPTWQVGDLVIIMIHGAGGTLGGAQTYAPPSGWTTAPWGRQVTENHASEWFYRVMQSGDGNPTFTRGIAGNALSAVASSYHSVATSNPFVAYSASFSNEYNNTRNAPIVTNTVTGAWIAIWAGIQDDGALASGPYTLRVQANAPHRTVVSDSNAGVATGTITPGTWTFESWLQSTHATVALRPAAGGATQDLAGEVSGESFLQGTLSIPSESHNSFIGASVSSKESAGSLTVDLPTGWQAGDFVVCAVNGNGAAVGVPAGWTHFSGSPVVQTNANTAYVYRVMQAGDSNPAFTGPNVMRGLALCYRGVSPTSPVGAGGASANATVGTSKSTPSLSVSVPGSWALLIVAANDVTTIGVPVPERAAIFGTTGGYGVASYDSSGPAVIGSNFANYTFGTARANTLLWVALTPEGESAVVPVDLAGTIEGDSFLSGDLTGQINLAGEVTAVSYLEGDLLIPTTPEVVILSGIIEGVSVLQGSLTGISVAALPGLRIGWDAVAPSSPWSFIEYNVYKRERGAAEWRRVHIEREIGKTEWTDYSVKSTLEFDYAVTWVASNAFTGEILESNKQSPAMSGMVVFNAIYLHEAGDPTRFIKLSSGHAQVSANQNITYDRARGRSLPTAYVGQLLSKKITVDSVPQWDRDLWDFIAQEQERQYTERAVMVLRLGYARQSYYVQMETPQETHVPVRYTTSLTFQEIFYDEEQGQR